MTSVVLTGGPSDHRPFIQSFRFTDGGGGFTAATYNLHRSTGNELEGMFERIEEHDASVLLLQELKPRRGVKGTLRKLGYRLKSVLPEFGIAWKHDEWEYVRHWRPLMSPTEYWTINYALVVVLKHRKTGKVVKFMTYHPPAHVQAPKHPTFQKVSKVLREVVRKWNKIARRNTKHIDACCFAGDDNVDEFKGWEPDGDGWEFMLHGPLRQVRAPDPTHGGVKHGRKIDDFRIDKGLRAV